MSKESYRIAAQVAANSGYSDNEFTHEIKKNGFIERFAVRIYIGAELDLRIKSFIRRGGSDGVEENIVQFKGNKDYIDGDDDYFEWFLEKEVKKNDVIVVQAKNGDATNAYDFAVDYDIDYRPLAKYIP